MHTPLSPLLNQIFIKMSSNEGKSEGGDKQPKRPRFTASKASAWVDEEEEQDAQRRCDGIREEKEASGGETSARCAPEGFRGVHVGRRPLS